ncbi:MAG: outer membrane protein [Bacillota bacterium]|nr:outer membrane protein [Bacillota bacterium]MDK2925630.1 outer membrane protein [Bacillota bacterium]
MQLFRTRGRLEKKSLALGVCLITFLASLQPVYAAPSTPEQQKVQELDLQKCLDLAQNMNPDLKLAALELESKRLAADKARFYSKKLKDAEEELDQGRSSLAQASNLLSQVEAGISALQQKKESVGLTPEEEAQLSTLEAQKAQLAAAISAGQTQLKEGESALTSGLEELNSKLSEKLGADSPRLFSVNSTRTLAERVADIAADVTQIGYYTAQHQVAVLVQKNYFDLLKARALAAAKKAAWQRAEKQYEIAQAAYQAGLKAKDDVVLAQVQANLLRADYENSLKDIAFAEAELKKAIGLPADAAVTFVETTPEASATEALEEGLKRGLARRLEMQQANGELEAAQLNFDLVKKAYPPNTYQYKEAALALEKAKANLTKAENQVRAEIVESYAAVQAAQKMLAAVEQTVEKAKENLEIAQYKYQVGWGDVSSANLKSIQAEDAAGTILEVFAAQEKLAQAEEKVIEIRYGYYLAIAKYQLDTGTGI